MVFVAATLAVSLLQGEVNPHLLGIGRRGTVKVAVGQLIDTRTGKEATLADVVKAADGKPFVFVGEEHATKDHQDFEAAVVKALSEGGRSVTVGMEMITRPKQDVLQAWSSGKLSEAEFLERVDWKGQWGYPYAFYRPVLEEVRLRKLPIVGLNVPRDWARTAGRAGVASLPMSAKMQLPPEIFLGNKEHRRVYDALVGPHAMPGANPENMYSAQVLWDEGMADSAIKYRALTPQEPSSVFVVIAGSGHVMYGQGINYRIQRRKGGKGTTIVMLQADGPTEVSRGIADFVFLSRSTSKEGAK